MVAATSGTLLDELNRLREDLATLRRELARFDELQQERETFVRMIAHDLRNCLVPLSSAADVIVRALEHKPSDDERRAAEVIAASARHMGLMIGELVDSIRLTSGHPSLKLMPTDLTALIESVARRAGTRGDHARIRICAADGPCIVMADPGQIERVVLNLLVNALKYSPPAAPVEVDLDRRDRVVVVSVVDHGDGIPPEELPRVFDQSFRGTNGRRNDGLGLGLYIARLCLEAHEGRIWVESEPGKGSNFRFLLPLARNQ